MSIMSLVIVIANLVIKLILFGLRITQIFRYRPDIDFHWYEGFIIKNECNPNYTKANVQNIEDIDFNLENGIEIIRDQNEDQAHSENEGQDRNKNASEGRNKIN